MLFPVLRRSGALTACRRPTVSHSPPGAWLSVLPPVKTSRCSAAENRRLLLLREVACRSSKENAAPHASWSRGSGGDSLWRAGTVTLPAGRSVFWVRGGVADPSAVRPVCGAGQGHRTLWCFHEDCKLPCLGNVNKVGGSAPYFRPQLFKIKIKITETRRSICLGHEI